MKLRNRYVNVVEPFHKVIVVSGLLMLAWSLSLKAAPRFELLRSFSATEGSPSGVVGDAEGNVYGTTNTGGDHDKGTLFKIAADGTYQVLYSFDGVQAANPNGLTLDAEGVLYGTAGILYGFDPRHSESGIRVLGNLPMDPSGNDLALVNGVLYGTTITGGTSGLGALYKFDIKHPELDVQLLASFQTNAGVFPYASKLAVDANGIIYGTTEAIAFNRVKFRDSFVFRKAGNGVLYKFDPNRPEIGVQSLFSDFRSSSAGVTANKDGILYGTYSPGIGSFNFEANPGPAALYKYDLNHPELGVQDLVTIEPLSAATRLSSLTIGADGVLYGIEGSVVNESGRVFAYDPSQPAQGAQTIVTFDGSSGVNPHLGLVLSLDGDLYGTTTEGGQFAGGTVYRLHFDKPKPKKCRHKHHRRGRSCRRKHH